MKRRSILARRSGRPAPPDFAERWAHTIYTMIKMVSVWALRKKWHQPPEDTNFSVSPPHHFAMRPWTGPVLLLGDNQIQHEFGDPESMSNMADRWSDPSNRPPLTLLFNHVLLDAQLERNAGAERPRPVLHLGDAINSSCRSEFDRFRASVLRALRKPERGARGPRTPFAMIPGNHDGFFLGNFQSRPRSGFYAQTGWAKLWRLIWNAQGVEWRCRCSDPFGTLPTAQGPFTKSDFVEEYFRLLTDLYGRPHTRHRIRRGRTLLRYIAPHADDTFVRIAYGVIDPQQPQRSFIVQVLQLPRAEGQPDDAPAPYMMLLDTSNYRSRPRNAGMRGAISSAQIRYARKMWLHVRRDTGSADRGAVLTFGMHHYLHALGPGSRRRFGKLALQIDGAAQTRVLPFCVSAHRHRGGWYTYVQRSGMWDRRRYLDWVELNASSMVDWPLAVRDLQIWMPRASAWTDHNWVVESNQRPMLTAAQLDDQLDDRSPNGIGEACRAAVNEVVAQRTSPLRRDPIRRLIAIVMSPMRDAYVAEYAILYTLATSLRIVLGAAACAAAAQRAGEEPARSEAIGLIDQVCALDAVTYEQRYTEAGFRPVEKFRVIRRVVYRGYHLVESLRRGDAALDSLLVALIAHSAREDYYSQWRANRFIPFFIADRWYRCAANIEERFALARVRRLGGAPAR